MFWCFPTHGIRFPRKDIGQNGRRRSNTVEGMQQHDAATDSGVYYLVPPNVHEPVRTTDRRAPPRRIPTPSNENWDEATTRGRTEIGGYTRGGPEKRAVLPPLPNSKTTNQAVSRTAPSPTQKPKAQVNTPLPRRPDVQRRATNETPSFQERQTEDTIETYGEYAHYMNELERQLGGGPDLALSPGRPRDHDGGARVQRVTNLATSKISKPTRLGTVVKPTATRVVQVAQPRPQQSLEIVDKRVVEDGPEQTVTISTWREQVAEEADQSANLHVYYMDPRDDPDGQRSAENRAGHEKLVLDEERPPRGPLQRPGRSESRTAFDVGSIRTISDEESTGSPPISRKRTPTESSESSEHPSPPRLERRLVSEASESQPSVPWNPTPPLTPPRDARAQDRSSSRSPNINDIGSASPVHSNTSARQTPDGMRLERAHTPMRSSTPNWTHTRPTLSSFHPTRSGSTISTIKSASVIAFENILVSCDPPLLHISPALERVGIRTENHLRAIARLSDETRDREIREEALKQGVTVMEWAILLDRLHLL